MHKRKSPRAVSGFAVLGQQPKQSVAGKFDLEIAARLSRELGVSAVTFWRWRHSAGFPPGTRINRRIYFSRSAIRAWLDSQQQAA
jgi:predicted DNA-binding transcriptional regulator AlpA